MSQENKTNVALYEVGSVFLTKKKLLQNNRKNSFVLAGAITGTWVDHKWQQEVKPVDFYVVKGIVEGLFRYLNIDVTYEQAVLKDMHPGRRATIFAGDKLIGFLGQVHPNISKRKRFKRNICI